MAKQAALRKYILDCGNRPCDSRGKGTGEQMKQHTFVEMDPNQASSDSKVCLWAHAAASRALPYCCFSLFCLEALARSVLCNMSF
jgi:hypothetical protein